jgi:hypothetical protein
MKAIQFQKIFSRMKSITVFSSNKLVIGIFCWILFMQSYYSNAQLNPGFETTSGSPVLPNGWTLESGSTAWSVPSGAPLRSGNNTLRVVVSTTNARTARHTSGYTVSIPAAGTNYVHVIGYALAGTSGDQARVQAISTTGTNVLGTLVNFSSTNTWQRFTCSGLATNNASYYPGFQVDGDNTFVSGDVYRFDDIIIYTSTSAGVDLTKPNAPSSLCVNTSGNDNLLTWTDGTDVATNTSGIDGVLILRAPAGTALPTVLDQAYYSTNSLIGPNTIGSWTVLHNGASTGSFTDPDAAGQPYIYAVYMRDRAFNYTTTPATYTTANAGPDQILACAISSTALAASPATGGLWSLESGGGVITDPTLATSNVSSLPDGTNTFKWTVTNGGCSTYDFVNIYAAAGIIINGNPLNDTVYNQQGTASFGVGVNPPVGVTYQWQVSTNGGGSWSNVTNGGTSPAYSGVSTAVLQVSNPPYAVNGYQYRCSVTNACASDFSPAATLAVLPITTFSNTTSQPCGTDFTNTFGNFTRNIVVSGLPSPLGNLTGQYVLRQVDLQLGNASCKRDLSTYRARIISPNGTVIDLFDNTSGTFTNNSVWMNTKFRDHESLERFTQYTTTVQTDYHPYSIGYYAIQTDGAFASVNGEDPNGTWVLQIVENVSTGNEISFERIVLHFGPPFNINDVTSSTSNDNCSQATCISSQEIVIGTNNSYSTLDPSFPGTTTDGCSWNGANNNSAWFKFVASQSTAYLTLSGIRAGSTGSDDTQPIVFSMSNPCVSGFSVPNGGCPNDETRNNMAYLTSNGGGTGTSGNVYVNGITANTEFNLSGLTVGQTYYLYVDGNGGASSTFYLEALFGCETCSTPLPVTLTSFTSSCHNNHTTLQWETATELNNHYYTLERSTDGANWRTVATVSGNGTTNSPSFYQWTDSELNYGLHYYRLTQTDYDGKFEVLNVISSACGIDADDISVLPNPNNGQFTIIGLEEGAQVQIVNIMGQLVYEETASTNFSVIELTDQPRGIYYIRVQSNQGQTTTKFIIE